MYVIFMFEKTPPNSATVKTSGRFSEVNFYGDPSRKGRSVCVCVQNEFPNSAVSNLFSCADH